MVRNKSLGRMVIFLCFGTAILSLAVHWRISIAQGQFKKPNISTITGTGDVYRSGLGATALGADTPPANLTPERLSPPQSSPIKSDDQSDTVKKNLASETNIPKKTLELTPELSPNSPLPNQSPSLLLQPAAHTKSSVQLENDKKEVVVNLSDRRAYVYAGDKVIASYPIAIGKKGWDTPTGSFKVSHMEHDPIWRHPITGQIFPAGPDSPLGERWIGFWSDGRNKIGFHGTPETHLLGTAISHGCIRMRNTDVRLLYDQVDVGTNVVVQE